MPRLFPDWSVFNLDAKSTRLLKSEHHKAVWSICLNILTDSPISEYINTSLFCETSSFYSFKMRLTRFSLIVNQYPDYHHVYSYITTSKNSLYPVVTQDTQRTITLMVWVISLRQPGQLRNQLHKSMRVKLNTLIKICIPWLILLPWQGQ